VITIKFSSTDCRHCPHLAQCCRSATQYPRHAALLAARAHQETATFAEAYAVRAGIEGTISRGVRTCALRRTRYIGRARTHLGHVFTATALNFLRLGEWLTDQPRPRSRRSSFARLMAETMVV